MRRVAAFAVALAWAGVACAEPPPPVGWKGAFGDVRIICLTPDQVAIFVEAHNDPDGPVTGRAVALLLNPPPQCAVAALSGTITVTDVVRLVPWEIGRGFSWPAYAIELATDKPFAWVLYLDANPALGV